MYDKRIKIFVILIAFFLLVCLLRLAQMQVRDDSFYRDKIAKLRLQQGQSRQLKTVRGKILDRHGRVLADDQSQFQLCINYSLSSFADPRVRQTKLQRAAQRNPALTPKLQDQCEKGLKNLQYVFDKCVSFGLQRADIEHRIEEINNKVWNLRTFLAWRRNGPDPDILKSYDYKITDIPFSKALADFEKKFPDENQRLLLISKIDNIAEMNKTWPLLELKTDDDIFTAQLEFLDINGVQVLPGAHRFYPYGATAAQTIGWVSSAAGKDGQLFADDKLSTYLDDEVCGREDGTEYVCEALLRGRRGEVVYDIDGQVISRTETKFGQDVSLTLDIELQKKIEDYLADCTRNRNCKAPMAVVVIEVATGDILALVSMPSFDLNRVRYDYARIAGDPARPLVNRAVNEQYPPGSVVKPLILIAGLESGKITPAETISCPAQPAPKGWPSCWLYNKYRSMGHDDNWTNNARNAVKGSCNIYFSRLADRIEPSVLQQWLFMFGYGRAALFAPAAVGLSVPYRNFRQVSGQISNYPPESAIAGPDQLPPLDKGERRYFGIGQGNLRASPLQVANAMAAVARGGLYKLPKLFIEQDGPEFDSVALNISRQTLNVVRDGMSAVVGEEGGTAYNEFAYTGFSQQGVRVYGKTGSTENPNNAWFAGFAEDQTGRSVVIAVMVEGGQHGASDAAPLARDIIQFCIEAKYVGPAVDGVKQKPAPR